MLSIRMCLHVCSFISHIELRKHFITNRFSSYATCSYSVEMADGEDIQPLVCDNGTGMVKVSAPPLNCYTFGLMHIPLIMCIL
jgi:hypothetical protein